MGVLDVATWPEYEAMRGQPEAWEPVKLAVCEKEGLDARRFVYQPGKGGTHVVWLDPPRAAIKLYCPFFPDSAVEQAVLRSLAGRLSLETPRLIGAGSVGGR